MAGRKYEEFVGRRVRLRRDVHLKNGEVWKKGSVCKVTSVSRGDIWLKTRNPNPENIFGPEFLTMHGVALYDFDLLPEKPKPRCVDEKCAHFVSDHGDEGCSKCKCTISNGDMVRVDDVAESQKKRPESDEDD